MQYDIFGCKVNKYYLNQRLGYFADKEDTELRYLVATCEVTDRAKQKWLKVVRQKLIQGYEVAITGCGVLRKGEVLPEDDFYRSFPELLVYKEHISLLGEAPENVEFRVQNAERNITTKKYIIVQNGCDNFCTFCLTIQKRGKHTSRSREEIVEEIKDFEQAGGKEIVLTGINLAARGCNDTKQTDQSQFAFLLREILRQTSIPRIRISSLGPEYLDDDFFAVIEDPRIMPHFHLSIQSFADPVLHAMKRNYDAKLLETVLRKFRKLQRSDAAYISLGADLIVGFPGETQEDFLATCAGVQTFAINKLHIFPFSAHTKGQTVPASMLPHQIAPAMIKAREAQLKTIGDEVRAAFLQRNIGVLHQVLVEGNGEGWTGNYIKIPLEAKSKRGDIVEVKI